MYNDDVTIDDLVSLFQPIKYLVKERPSFGFVEFFDDIEVCLDCLSLRDVMTISSMMDDYNIDIDRITNVNFTKIKKVISAYRKADGINSANIPIRVMMF